MRERLFIIIYITNSIPQSLLRMTIMLMTITAMLLFAFIGIANLKHFFNKTSFSLNLFSNYTFLNTTNDKIFLIKLNNSHSNGF